MKDIEIQVIWQIEISEIHNSVYVIMAIPYGLHDLQI